MIKTESGKMRKNKEGLSFQIQKIDEFFKESREYLKEIGVKRKLKEGKNFSPKEIRQILVSNIQRYIDGEVNQKFVLGLGSILHNEVFMGGQISGSAKEVELVASATCSLDDLAIATPGSKKTKKSPEEIDLVIRNIFEDLKQKNQTPS